MSIRQKVMTIVALACAWRVVLAAEDPPTPGGFRLRSEASTFAGPTADKTARQDGGQGFPKPYSPPCVERENVFEFTEKPAVKTVGPDRYEITFAVKGNCDVTVGIVDGEGKVVRHLGSGVLGANAPAPFQKNSLKQTLYWNGKDDLSEYHKTPEKLRVRVMLGLKPEFDKLLLGKSPKTLAPWIWGIAVGPDGAYVFAKTYGPDRGPGSWGHLSCRKFDHDGGYVMSLLPAPANLPQEKLGGLGFIEYEPGVRALQGVPVNGIINDRANIFETTDHQAVLLCQPFLLGQKLHFFGRGGFGSPNYLHRMNTDGSTDVQEISSLFGKGLGKYARMAGSADGRWFYFVSGSSSQTFSGYGGFSFETAVWRAPLNGSEPAKAFIGDPKAPGSDNQHFQEARGLDSDTTGRLYVCDSGNNRIQIFSAEGKHLKTVPVDRPDQVRIHPKTGALYVLHQARVEGKSLGRLTKFTSFDAPVEEWHVDHVGGQALAVDAWTAKPRLWLAAGGNVSIYEEDGKKLNKVADFQEDAKKEEGGNHIGQWGGDGESAEGKVVCDPVRERVYFANRYFFDLKTGALLFENPGRGDDAAFDKRGYMHWHWCGGVARLDPGRAVPNPWHPDYGGERVKPWPRMVFPECPYDYGEEGNGLIGIIKTKDQAGAKTFQDGLGVNMMGDVVEQCNIYWAPKMEAEAEAFAMTGPRANIAAGQWCEEGNRTNDRFVKEMEKKGESVYFIRREAGIPVLGGTIWTFARNGELRQELAVNTGWLINGVQMDEESRIYFVVSRPALRNGRPFLAGNGGTFGAPGDKRGANPFTGTLMKTSGKKTHFLSTHAPVPMDEKPKRPADLAGDFGSIWVEEMEWLYAGASPIVADGCSCPTQRLHLDWYKRTFVPETYRHSFGVLDTAGNLIMHLGKYGNYDSGNGAKSKIPVGGDNIAMYFPRFISGTDNFLVFSDWGERLVVLKLNYQAEESVGIGEVMSGK